MKKIGIILLVIIIIILGISTFSLYSQLNEQNAEKEKLEAQVSEQTSQIENLQNTLNTIENTISNNKKETIELEEIPIGKVNNDKFKVSAEISRYYYEKDVENRDYDTMVEVNISDKKAYITLDNKSETLQSICESEDIEKPKDIENKEITGFSSNPVKVFFGQFGQDIVGEKILFLMEDGSVEYISVVDMLKAQDYKSEGKIKNLSNVKQFDILSVYDTEGGGYTTTIAIDQDGHYYDLNELL